MWRRGRRHPRRPPARARRGRAVSVCARPGPLQAARAHGGARRAPPQCHRQGTEERTGVAARPGAAGPAMSDTRALREELRDWLSEHQRGEFARYSTEPMVGTRLVPPEISIAWERQLAAGHWVGLTIPEEFGGRGLSIDAQLAFFEEYARSRAMPRLPTIGESLLAPTLLHAGSRQLQQRFLPPIVAATELWCQGYSEPGAGSDLASLRTRATLDGDRW